jgi:hypothetical protein
MEGRMGSKAEYEAKKAAREGPPSSMAAPPVERIAKERVAALTASDDGHHLPV